MNALSNTNEIVNWCKQIQTLKDVDTINDEITSVHKVMLDVLAPERVFKIRDDTQVINSEIEAIKKRRNRKFILYKKTGAPGYLLEAKKLSKTIQLG